MWYHRWYFQGKFVEKKYKFNSTDCNKLQICSDLDNGLELIGFKPASKPMINVRTDHSSGRPRLVYTVQGRVKLTHQSSDRTSGNFVWKKHNQPTFHETTATNSHSIRTMNSILEAAILSLLVHMLSCAWWERSVQFCLVPCSERCQCNWVE